MRAKRLDRFCLAAPATFAVGGLCQQGDRSVHAGIEHVARTGELSIFAIMPQIGAIASNRRLDFLARFGMLANDTRQVDQLYRPFEIEIVKVLGDAGTLGFLALAHLDIGAKPARLPLDRQARFRVIAQHCILGAILPIRARLGETAGEFAFGIIGTGDKGSELSTPQRQTAIFPAFLLAQRTKARVLAIFPLREEIVGQIFVQNLGHFGRHLVHDLVGLGFEIFPEFGQQLLVFLAPVGHDIKLVLHSGGEIISDILLKETFEEGCQQPPAFFREETVLFHPNIIAVTQRLDGRGIG